MVVARVRRRGMVVGRRIFDDRFGFFSSSFSGDMSWSWGVSGGVRPLFVVRWSIILSFCLDISGCRRLVFLRRRVKVFVRHLINSFTPEF